MYMKICKKIGIFTFDFGQMIEQNMSGAINITFRSRNGRKMGKSISI